MASDLEQLVFAISADITQLKRALQRGQGDIKAFAGQANAALSTVNGKGMQQAYGQSLRMMQNDTRNLTFQMNDIIQGLATGTSPFTLMMQQGSQVTQALGSRGLVGGLAMVGRSLMSLLNPTALVTFALIGLTAAAVKYFTDSEKEAKSANEEWEKHASTIAKVAKEYDRLAPEAAKALKELAIEAGMKVQLDQLTTGLEELGKTNLTVLNKTIEGLGDAIDGVDIPALIDKMGMEEAHGIIERVKSTVEDLRDDVENARDPMLQFNALIEQLQYMDMEAPGKGFQELADRLKSDVLPLLEKQATRVKGIAELMKLLDGATAKVVDQQERYDKAMQTMDSIGKPTLTELQKLMDAYGAAVAAAAGNQERLNEATDAFNAGKMGLDAAANLSQLTGEIKSAFDLIAKFEDFRANAYLDKSVSGTKDAYRVGFGSDTYVDEMGKVQRVTKDTVTTVQRATEDLNRRILEFQAVIKRQIGAELWHGMNEAQQAALSSIAYNYGNLPPTIVKAIKSGDHGQVARAIADLSSNKDRRLKEAKLYASGFPDGGDPLAVREQIQAQKELNEAERAEAVIRGETNAGIDETVRKREYLLKLDELTRKAKEAARAEGEGGRELYEEEIAGIEAQAQAWAKLQGQKAAAAQAVTFGEGIENVLERAAAIEVEQRAIGNLGTAIDELTYKREYAAMVQQLTRLASEDGTAATETETRAIHNAADAYARATASKEAFNNSTKAAAKDQNNFAQQVSGIAQSALGGFISDLRKGVDAGEAFANMLDKIIDGLINMALEALFSKQMMGGLFGGMGGGGGMFQAGAGLWHKGGRVSSGGVRDGRRFSPALWAGAPSYATGGIAGLKPGEVPAILHRGELVIPTSGLKTASGKMQGDTINTTLGNVQIDMSKSGFVAADNERAKSFATNVQKLIQLELVRESRPGGLLRSSPR